MTTAFRYDRTLNGLLTAVFDAFSRKTIPEILLSPDQTEPLFTDILHRVITDDVKAGRVWRALEKKTERRVCNMIVHAWLSEEPDSEELIFRYLCRLFTGESVSHLNFADKAVFEMHRLALKVTHEGAHLRQFLRFQKASDGSYFAPVEPKYNALPLVIDYLKDRFRDQTWLVYDTKRHYGFFYDQKTVREVTLEDDTHLLDGKLGDGIAADDEKLFQQMWKNYFKALAIKERINPKLQRQHMPRRFWRYLTEKQ